MKTRHLWLAGLLALAACGSEATAPSPEARPAYDSGGGLMGSGTVVQPPTPRDSTSP